MHETLHLQDPELVRLLCRLYKDRRQRDGTLYSQIRRRQLVDFGICTKFTLYPGGLPRVRLTPLGVEIVETLILTKGKKMPKLLYTVLLPGEAGRDTEDFIAARTDVVRACIEGAQRGLDNRDDAAVVHYLQQAKMALGWVDTLPAWSGDSFTYRTVSFHPDRVYASIEVRRVEDD